MKTIDAILMGLTIGVARVLRGLLKTYNRLISLVRPEPMTPFAKCDKVLRLRNNRVVNDESGDWRSLPLTNEEAPRRQIVQ